MNRKILLAKVIEKLARPRAPKGWWDKKYKEVKEGNPSYSEEQVRATVGKIWTNISDSKVQEIKKRHYK